jgi:hypothetical protein|tara:strand:+ start:653 stop:1360 length:708 start_codon:yes stop_codon:yes gene_type:complete
MTEAQITFDIMEILRGNQISDDTDIDSRQVIFQINNQRALYIRNEYNKPGRKVDPFIEQDLGCVKLVAVDGADCCDVEISVDCTLLRTEHKIPNTIDLHNGPAITRVGPIMKTKTPFSFIPYNRAIYATDEKYAKRVIQAFLLNGYIYVTIPTAGNMFLEYINVRGIFETPSDAATFCTSDGATCYDKTTSEYPISGWMYTYLKQQVLQHFSMALQIPKDKQGDSQESITGPATK